MKKTLRLLTIATAMVAGSAFPAAASAQVAGPDMPTNDSVATANTPALAWSPSGHDYGAVPLGQTALQTFTLSNPGGGSSGKLTITLSGPTALTITADTCSDRNLTSKKSCTVTVQFAPTTSGQSSATLTAAGKRAGATITLTGGSAAPVADAGGPYTVNEGSGVTLDGTGSTAGAIATFEWDLDGDGQFDDATGPNPSVSAGMLASLGLGDGPAGPVTVSLRVTDDALSNVDTTTLTVVNVAPVVSVTSVPSGVVAGVQASMTFAADDAAAADNAAGFTYAINWGDGTPQQVVTGAGSVTVFHTWIASGTFTVSVTATDKDAGTAAATAIVTVGG